MKLQEALTSLAISPVSKYREAISRIERTVGKDINTIVAQLENESVLVNILQDQFSANVRRNTRMLILSAGLMCGGLSCLLTIWFKPSLTYLPIAVAPIGFITGAAAQIIRLLK